MKTKLKVGVFGGSGYVGLELIRLLIQHPMVTLSVVTSREHKDKPISDIHRGLAGLCPLHFSDPGQSFDDLDLLFLAVPHTQSSVLMTRLAETPHVKNGSLRVIDLGADFRLPAERFLHIYQTPHPCPELLTAAVYGLPELHKEAIAAARLVANPGCFAHCITLGILPIAQAIAQALAARHVPCDSEIIARVSAVTGSSGSGASASQKTHHPERNESMVAYDILTHRHVPEIEQALALASTKNQHFNVQLVPHSGNFSRGIYATIFLTLPETLASDPKFSAVELYRTFASREPFVRYRETPPRLIDVRGSNFCDLHVRQNGAEIIVISALDNLVKGAAGTAVHNMNLMYKFEESCGLMFPPLAP